MFSSQKIIRPSADLRNHYNEISKLLEMLSEAEEDIKNERIAPVSEMFDDLRKKLQEG